MSPVPPRWRLVVASRAFCALVGSAEVSLHCRPRRLAGSSWAPRAQGGSAKVWPRCHPRRVAGPSSHLPRFPRVLSLPVSFGSRLRHLGALLRVALRGPPPILPHPPLGTTAVSASLPPRIVYLIIFAFFPISCSPSWNIRGPAEAVWGASWAVLEPAWDILELS